MHGGHRRLEREFFHDLDRPGQKSAGHHRRDGVARLLQGEVAREHGVKGLGPREQLQCDLQRDSEKALVPHKQPRPVRTDLLAALAAEGYHFAGREHRLEAEHMIRGHAVFQAMRATGVERHVATDRADLLAGGIRREMQTKRRRRRGDREIDHPRLHDRNPLRRIEPEDPVQPVQRDYDAAFDGQRTTRQTCAAAARDKREVLGVAKPHERDHFLLRLRHHDRQRHGPERGQRVALIRRQLGRSAHETIRRQQRLEALQDGGGKRVFHG